MSAEANRRVFFAFIPDADTRAALRARIKPLRDSRDQRLRWLKSDGWHVTLRFVGNVSEEMMDRLTQLLRDVVPRHAGFEMVFSAVQVFPSARRPLVLAAVGEAPEPAVGLAAELEAGCRAMGLPADLRGWRPHLSVARIRGRRAFDVPSQPVSVACRVRRVCLMESVASRSGSEYVRVAQVPLS